MTRRERIKLNRERERAASIGGEGLKLSVSREYRCDQCGEAAGTLYHVGGGVMTCIEHVPVTWKDNAAKLLSRAASGKAAIMAKRKSTAASAMGVS